MAIAIVGGGLFGCTTAIHLANAGFKVDLYERRARIMSGASMVNQLRFHEGYHYPRSNKTVAECQDAKRSFTQVYGAAVINEGQQYYAIPEVGSRTDPDTYERFMHRQGLEFTQVTDTTFLRGMAATYAVREARISSVVLQGIIEEKLGAAGVNVRLKSNLYDRRSYKHIVICAYAGMNEAVKTLGCLPATYQYEVVEKPIIKLPGFLRNTGVVVIDGEFFSVDPYGFSPFHVMGHVREAIWTRNTGEKPYVEPFMRSLFGRVVQKPKHTKFPMMQWAAKDYMPAMQKAQHISSMYTIRAVLPNVDDTDERPTLVQQLDDQVIRVFSGKLTHCVDAAGQVLGLVHPSSRNSKDHRAESVD